MSLLLVGAGCAKGPAPESVTQPVATTTVKTEQKVEQLKPEVKPTPTKPVKVSLTDGVLAMGSWDKVSGNLDLEFGFDSIEFYASGRYSSYLGGTHLNDGQWDLENGTLDLILADGTGETFFTSVRLEGDTLTMKEGSKTIIWKHNK